MRVTESCSTVQGWDPARFGIKMKTTLIALLVARALSFVPVTPSYGSRAVGVHAELRRDEQGYIVKEDLDWPDLTLNPLSDNLGASSVKMPDACLAHVEKCASASPPQFTETIAMIEEYFDYLPVAFSVGAQKNAQGENEGSAKVFSFARFANLEAEPTLQLFCEHYASVVQSPDGTDHANIRAFMASGRSEVSFPNGLALTPKAGSWDTDSYSSDTGLDESSKVEGDGGWDFDSDIWIP